jgi:CRISPR-associated protein (TIGR03985 family)
VNVLFDNPPYLKLLQHLAKGSLEQSHHLIRAIRLYALLRWLYSDQGYSVLGDSFTYADWRKAFFNETHKDEKQKDILNHQDPNCACIKTTKEWLLESDVSIDEWQNSLQKQIPLSDSDLERLLQERLFAQVRKSLQSDLDLLVDRNWLQRVTHVTGRSKHYRRVEILPISNNLENLGTESNLTAKEQVYLAETLGMFSFLDPSLPLLAEQISEPVEEGTHRVFLYVDYVVPESSPKQDVVDQLQSELQEIWDSGKIPPLLLTYHSAHQNQIKECVVYPVCIYFMERAKYLCAYGSTPKDEINWHKYRLDRIISKRLVHLDWEDTRVPQLLREKYEDDQLPTPKTVNAKLREAWGCDFYKEKAPMILRFEENFHNCYVQGLTVHDTFTIISHNQAVRFLKQHTSNPQNLQTLLEILQSRPVADAYYQVYFRRTDYYVVRWLRALGSKVEVIFPWDLRQEMAMEAQNTWNLYK